MNKRFKFKNDKKYEIKWFDAFGFSGWAQSKRFAFGRRTDYSITMSDHCDFNELVEMVLKSEAQQVYTIHGFVEEFALHLQKLGIKLSALSFIIYSITHKLTYDIKILYIIPTLSLSNKTSIKHKSTIEKRVYDCLFKYESYISIPINDFSQIIFHFL